MTVDLKSTPLEPLALQSRVVQFGAAAGCRLYRDGRMRTALDTLALVTAISIIVTFASMLGAMLLGWLP